MGEKVKKITQDTLIPIGIMALLISATVTIVWLFSGVTTKVDAMEAQDCPSRDEFNTMQNNITTISSDVKTILRTMR